jgi:ABC-type branched-subunit amino acid transport system substrate-binding protein
MLSRRVFLQSSAAAATWTASRVGAARAANAPGVTDAEIKIGQTMPYSGPASPYGVIGRAELAYFKMINDSGGVNGRKLNLISLDDGLSPPKTVEQTRRLVENENVALIFGTLGTPTNAAIRSYLNDNKVPQLFIGAGSEMFADPRHYPWTISFIASWRSEGRVYAKHILETKPGARIGVLFANDDEGRDFVAGVREALGDGHAAMIVRQVSYENSDPTVDSQIFTLQGAGVDTLLIAAIAKQAVQTIRKASDIGWTPERYLISPSSSIPMVLKAAGLDRSKGIITNYWGKDTGDPRWKDDAGYEAYVAFVEKYMTPAQLAEPAVNYAFNVSTLLVHVLKQCGDDLSRENIMRQAGNIKDFELPLLLPGIKVNTSPDNFRTIRKLQLARFDGENWVLFGGLIED